MKVHRNGERERVELCMCVSVFFFSRYVTGEWRGPQRARIVKAI